MQHNQFPVKAGGRGQQGYLREISILNVNPGHAVEPRLPELGRAGIGLGQAVLQVHQHFRVILMLLHLGRGHQDCAYPLGQILHIGGETGVLKQGWEKEGNMAFICFLCDVTYVWG